MGKLLVKGRKRGTYAWGSWNGTDGRLNPANACLIARALNREVESPADEAIDTQLRRALTAREEAAIMHADERKATREDKGIIHYLALMMGVEF